MQIIEVIDNKGANEFLDVAREIYVNDTEWVCPLDNDIRAVFDPKVNTYFNHGEACRWILKNNGQLIGRIAAFINEKKADYEDKRIGGLGFFECIEDEDAAKLLFDTAVAWLKERRINTIDGPINFGENDQYWGLLVEGFSSPSYGMAYNPPYYQKFFENYGFKVKMEQMTNKFYLKEGLSPRFVKIANYIMERKPSISTERFDPKRIDKYAEDFLYIYNAAWAEFENFTPIKKEYVLETFKQMKPVLDPNLVQFAYVNGEPASFVLSLPDVNQIFKRFKGKLNLINKIRFVLLKRKKMIDRVRVVVMGTHPKFQGIGLESVVTYKSFEYCFNETPLNEVELSWVGDFNDKMIAIHKGLGAVPSKKHITYRLELN
ncbi:hypothetical protein [Roseivirga misakiensis]|uniref:N-acetyltransferase domain-containing protein n=1 Tax=Roseivirga misakiensis TaxID=1563681 RepID=A0A1E5T574_9BACT|nr:hypothetical protein [Roseivirga misakiensis]OEK06522.1 hypothetical protein BFP71_02290 [Roseivirga misakiensis]